MPAIFMPENEEEYVKVVPYEDYDPEPEGNDSSSDNQPCDLPFELQDAGIQAMLMFNGDDNACKDDCECSKSLDVPTDVELGQKYAWKRTLETGLEQGYQRIEVDKTFWDKFWSGDEKWEEFAKNSMGTVDKTEDGTKYYITVGATKVSEDKVDYPLAAENNMTIHTHPTGVQPLPSVDRNDSYNDFTEAKLKSNKGTNFIRSGPCLLAWKVECPDKIKDCLKTKTFDQRKTQYSTNSKPYRTVLGRTSPGNQRNALNNIQHNVSAFMDAFGDCGVCIYIKCNTKKSQRFDKLKRSDLADYPDYSKAEMRDLDLPE